MSSPNDSLHYTLSTISSSSLVPTDQRSVLFSKTSVNLALPQDGTLGVAPEHFKLIWEAEPGSSLHHRIDRIIFFSPKTRIIIPLPNSVPLEGLKGEVPLHSAASPELFKWTNLVGHSNVTAIFAFRPLSKLSDIASETLSKINTITRYAQNDVLFLFPSQTESIPPRCLWSKSEVLAKSSPYFKTLFSSEGFVETDDKIDPPTFSREALEGKEKAPISKAVVSRGTAENADCEVTGGTSRGSKRKADHLEKENDDTFTKEDSDIENDYFSSPSPSPSIHRIVIHDVAYKTLFAYLYYIETNSVTFDPLSSLLPPSYSPPPYKPSSAPSCSPKSMYNLAKFYEHQTLSELAYNSIASQLDCCNALLELFSDLSANFEEIKALCIQAVLDNWKYIKDSKQMKELQEEMKSGNLESRKLGLMFDLFPKLQPATS